jgi:uncharacterized protein (DUF342 family)
LLQETKIKKLTSTLETKEEELSSLTLITSKFQEQIQFEAEKFNQQLFHAEFIENKLEKDNFESNSEFVNNTEISSSRSPEHKNENQINKLNQEIEKDKNENESEHKEPNYEEG